VEDVFYLVSLVYTRCAQNLSAAILYEKARWDTRIYLSADFTLILIDVPGHYIVLCVQVLQECVLLSHPGVP